MMMPYPAFPSDFTFISDEVSQDIEVVIAFAQRHGFAGFELRSMFGRQFRELTSADLDLVRRRTEAAGLRIIGCATPVFKCPLHDDAAVAEHRALFRRAVETAEMLRCGLVRVFSFLRQPTPPNEDAIRRIAEHLDDLVQSCPRQIRIGVENEASCMIATEDEMAALFRQTSPALGMIWDPCNVLYVPGAGDIGGPAFTWLAPRLVHVHVKDARREPGGVVAFPVGEGEVDWPRQLGAIANSGYTGMYALETHWRRRALAAEELHLPGGFRFSAGGAEASEMCVAALRRMCPDRGR